MKRLVFALMLLAAGAAFANGQERERRAADIAYWTTGYQGKDLVSGKYACPMPKIPLVSKTNEEINRVQAEIAQWESCYNDFVAGVNQAGTADKRIPADVLKRMSPSEVQQAIAHVDDVTVGIINRRQAEALAFTSERDNWFNATQQFVAEQNAKGEAEKKNYEISMRQTRDANDEFSRRQPTATFNPTPTTGKQ